MILDNRIFRYGIKIYAFKIINKVISKKIKVMKEYEKILRRPD